MAAVVVVEAVGLAARRLFSTVGWAGLLEDRVIFLTYCLRINYRLLHPLHSQVPPELSQILAKDKAATFRVTFGDRRRVRPSVFSYFQE